MKFLFIHGRLGGNGFPLKKIFIIMKFVIFILLIGLSQVSANSFGQITLREKNAPFEKVMTAIRQQSNYSIFYNENIKAHLITVDAENADIKEVLDKCFMHLPVTYKIVGNNIFLKEEEVKHDKNDINEMQPAFITISGVIKNMEGHTIYNASIVVKGTKLGTLTNNEGVFRLENVPTSSTLRISCIGYLPIELGIQKIKDSFKTSASGREFVSGFEFKADGTIFLNLKLGGSISELKSVSVTVGATPKQNGTMVDMTRRQHLNLGQVLEGSVPGLTLKNIRTTTKEVNLNTGIMDGDYQMYTGVEDLRRKYQSEIARYPILLDNPVYQNFEAYYASFNQLANSSPIAGTYFTSTKTTSSGLVPELRGSTSLGNTNGMLVVIDGVEQNDFPANYPMNNVLSIEVVKDPVVLAKWGARATGGLILITTNGGNIGKLSFDYNANVTFTNKPNFSHKQLQLASSEDVLDYYKEMEDKGLTNYIPIDDDYTYPPVGLKPAQWLLYNMKKNGLSYTDEPFKKSWDSLARLDNQHQIQDFYRNAFAQNHNLNVSGGKSYWAFSLGGVYSRELGALPTDKGNDFRLNLKNNFNLLKNRLKIDWVLNAGKRRNKYSLFDNFAGSDPYQMLKNADGGYVYDYSGSVSEVLNRELQALSYENAGVNAIEDALNTINIEKSTQIDSRINTKWELVKNLKWASTFIYKKQAFNTNNTYGENSSMVRNLRNRFGAYDAIAGVNFYVPEGAMLENNKREHREWNLRSALSYQHVFNEDNILNGAFAISGAHSQNLFKPNETIYGYSSKHPNGQAVLPFEDGVIFDYFGQALYRNILSNTQIGTASYDRNLSINGNLGFAHQHRYFLNIVYNSLYVPTVGFNPTYTGTKNYEANMAWQVEKENFFKVPFINNLQLGLLANHIQLGDFPNTVRTFLIAQPEWNNVALKANGFLPSMLNGQTLKSIGATIQLGLWKDLIGLKGALSKLSDKTYQLNGQIFYQLSKSKWFSLAFVDNLMLDASYQNFNSFQGASMLMSNNLPNGEGDFSMSTMSNLDFLPPATINKEIHLSAEMLKNRLVVDARFYHKTTTNTANVGLLAPDPSTGVNTQMSSTKMLNKGFELFITGKIINKLNFNYQITINGAYNINKALDVPIVPFIQGVGYLSASRSGFATDALWSYVWAGLDDKGNPQVYNDGLKMPVLAVNEIGEPVSTVLNPNMLVYSGRTKAPWTGALIQQWNYKNIFVSARVLFQFGHIMRRYYPGVSVILDNSIDLKNRWKKPGDEQFTDVAALAPYNATRELIIQNSTNSILSANHISLAEIQLGYDVPFRVLKGKQIKNLTVSTQISNVALWTKNKLGVDPRVVSTNGRANITTPRSYSITLSTSF